MLTRVAFIATEEDGGAIGECVSGYGNYHDLGGGKHQPPTGHGYPPPHHKASRGKRGGKREKERRQKRAKHGTTKPSDLSAEKPTPSNLSDHNLQMIVILRQKILGEDWRGER